MIRRKWTGFRIALMLLDAALAGGLLVALTMLRYGTDWRPVWQALVAEPIALPFIVGGLWVGILTYFGLYRPRARWSIRSEAADIVRSTAVLAAIVLAALFSARLVDVSRLFLLGFFPALAAATLLDRLVAPGAVPALSGGRPQPPARPRRGRGPAGPGVREEARGPSRARAEVIGFLDDRVAWTPLPWPVLGKLEHIETILHERVIDEVAICLPYNQWDKVDAITQLCQDEGKIVRVPIELLSRAFSAGRIEELDGTPVYSLVSGPDRAVALALKRTLDIVVSAIALVVLSPILLAIAVASGRWRSAGALPPGPRRAARPPVHRGEVPDDDARRRVALRRGRGAERGRGAGIQVTTTRGSRRSGGSCGGPASTSCRSSGTCCAAR